MTIKMLVASAAVAVLLTGCSLPTSKRISDVKALTANCPHHQTLAEAVALDVGAGQRGAQLASARLTAVRDAALQTAACSGHLRVVIFGPSPAASATLFDGDLHPAGETETARLLRVPKLANTVQQEVKTAMQNDVGRITSVGQDPLTALNLGRDYASEVGANAQLDLLVETSGNESTRVRLPQTLTDSTAARLASTVTVNGLTHVHVTWAGIGRVGAGAPPSPTRVNALQTFYRDVCHTVHAASCETLTTIVPLQR